MAENGAIGTSGPINAITSAKLPEKQGRWQQLF